MRELYAQNSANYPRLKTDRFFADYDNLYKYNGFVDKTIKYIEEFQLLDSVTWKRFVRQFREKADTDNGWRGEYWGKMMRGACLTYSYTKNPALYEELTKTVLDMLDSADENGGITSYSPEKEFGAWDMWSRKYVLLGMQHFLEICTDDSLKEKVVSCMCAQVDRIMERVGNPAEEKVRITYTTSVHRGLNSSSILEPIVRLYNITKQQKYLDFAKHIVDCGATAVENLFNLAYENKLYPYQYPITKAYEMISCFEGLLEYYRVTGDEHYKTAVINFANKVLETDFTIIGSSGCTHELFDHSTVRQANTTNHKVAQETCVTVTLMKFFYQLTLLTGDSKYVDAFEISMYNAYFGAVNTDKVSEQSVPDWMKSLEYIIEPLPFDSYSPLTAGKRGLYAGGVRYMSDKHYYGCCACIGSAGNGIIPKMALLSSENGFVINLFIDGTVKTTTPSENQITFETSTNYPVDGNVKITLNLDKNESFEVLVRNPLWSKTTKVKVNGKEYAVNEGYIPIVREWADGDVIELDIDMRTKALYPIPYGNQVILTKLVWGLDYVVPVYDEEDPIAKNHIALRRGPIMLAQENRLGYSVDTPISIKVNADGYVDVTFPEKEIAPYEHILEVCVPLDDGTQMHVTDYASAGKRWNDESKMAVWMLTK